MKKRTEIILEVEEYVCELSIPRQLIWCPECAQEVRMVSPETGALWSGQSTRLVYQKLESGFLHYKESKDGSLKICLPSLMSKR